MTTRPLGDFGYATAVGCFDSNLANHDPARTRFGLPMGVTYLYGGWRDEQGALHICERKFVGSMTAGLWLMTLRGERVHLEEVSLQTVRGEFKREIGAREHRYHGSLLGKAGGAPEEGLDFRLTEGAISWREGATLQLEGSVVGPGIQIFAADATNPLLYASELYKIGGTVLGEQVDGFVFVDHGYWPAGLEWKEFVVFNNYQLAWTAFASELDDGSIEWGQICIGRDGFNFVVVANQDGPIVADTRTHGGVDLSDDGWAPRIAYRAHDGRTWMFELAENGQLGIFSAARWGSYRGQAGKVRRVGDTRGEKIAFAWGEYLLDRVREDAIPDVDVVMKAAVTG